MACTPAPMDCSVFATRNDFDTYISTLLNVTCGNLTLISECREEVCVALWGNGNPDVSGIGMIIGYTFDHALGLILSAAVMASSLLNKKVVHKTVKRLLNSFGDCAAFLCFSIQIAAIVVLVEEDAGINTAGMGGGTVRITEAVSALTLLPLIYPVVVLLLLDAPEKAEDSDPQATRKPSNQSKSTTVSSNTASKPAGSGNATLDVKRFGFLVGCWLLAFYPFCSKMNNEFGQSQISNSPGSAISEQQFAVIESVCFQNVTPLTWAEDRLMSAVAILSYIPVSLFIVGCIVALAMRKHHEDSRLYRTFARYSRGQRRTWVRRVALGGLAMIPLLACGLTWTILRIQRFQTELAGGSDTDSKWTFGQVVAVTVFVPVIVEGWAVYLEHRKTI